MKSSLHKLLLVHRIKRKREQSTALFERIRATCNFYVVTQIIFIDGVWNKLTTNASLLNTKKTTIIGAQYRQGCILWLTAFAKPAVEFHQGTINDGNVQPLYFRSHCCVVIAMANRHLRYTVFTYACDCIARFSSTLSVSLRNDHLL